MGKIKPGKSLKYEKYLTVKILYMEPERKGIKFTQRIEAVADDVKCHETTLRKWNNEMLNKLAIKLFGVDGLKLDV